MNFPSAFVFMVETNEIYVKCGKNISDTSWTYLYVMYGIYYSVNNCKHTDMRIFELLCAVFYIKDCKTCSEVTRFSQNESKTARTSCNRASNWQIERVKYLTNKHYNILT